MRIFRSFVLYTALAIGANAAHAGHDDLAALREGTLKKLVFAPAPSEVSQIPFLAPDGTRHSLSEWKGKYVLVNFWATWCAPCRKEMSSLAALQRDFSGPAFEVVTIATTRNTLSGIRRFFDEIGADNLPMFMDVDQALSHDMGVFGLPTTVLIDPDGKEIARMRGDADWNSESARAIVSALVNEGS